MWLLGHLALGYFSALAVSRLTREKINILLVFFVSISPDFDIFFRRIIEHRGPSHSIIIVVVAVIPFLLVIRRGFPYFAALLSHSLIGDYVIQSPPAIQLLWPLTRGWYENGSSFLLYGFRETIFEVSLFVLMVAVILYNRKK